VIVRVPVRREVLEAVEDLSARVEADVNADLEELARLGVDREKLRLRAAATDPGSVAAVEVRGSTDPA
jgi:hypothetical protein